MYIYIYTFFWFVYFLVKLDRKSINDKIHSSNSINDDVVGLPKETAEDSACVISASGISSVASLKLRVLWTCVVFYAHACMVCRASRPTA